MNLNAERIDIEKREYSQWHMEKLVGFMKQYGFDYASLNYEGKFVLEYTLIYRYFRVAISYVYQDDNLGIWINEHSEPLYIGAFPGQALFEDTIDTAIQFKHWIEGIVRSKIFN